MGFAALGPFHWMNKPGLACWRVRDHVGKNQGASADLAVDR